MDRPYIWIFAWSRWRFK